MMEGSLDHFELWTGLFGGLALFLFGMDLMTKALKRAAGDHMKDLLGRFTKNRFMGVGMGMLVTGIVNSSSVTTVIVVGFISAGLMSMAQSISIIMGANIGSTVTAQILAFNVTRFALPLITIGFVLSFAAKRDDQQEYGRLLLGLGLVFYGMGVMSDAMAPLRGYPPFVDFIASLSNPLAAVLAGAAFTAIIQSSAATTGLVIVLAGQALMSLETGIAVALGANIGTCATAGLAAIGKPREAVRAALVHVLFNIAGVLVWLGFIPQLAELAREISPTADQLTGVARMASEAPRQVANAHTIFNVANTLLFIGFTTQFARLVEWLVPDKPLSEDEPLAPRFLDEDLISTPAVALSGARQEIGRMGKYAVEMLDQALPAILGGSKNNLRRITALDKPLDKLHRSLIEYLGKISSHPLSEEQSQNLLQLVEIANDLEHLGDRVATDLITSANKRLEEGVAVSPESARQISEFHGEVSRALAKAIEAVVSQDADIATQVRHLKKQVNSFSSRIERERFKNVGKEPGASVRAYVREVECLEILDGIFKIARRIARTQLNFTAMREPEVNT
jgi:phosphate:Na+ symporter